HAIRFSDVCVVVMDQAEAFEKQDLAIADLVVREGRALVYVLAKWDQAQDAQARFNEMREQARQAIPEAREAALVRVAAMAGRGLEERMKAAGRARGDGNAREKPSTPTAGFQHAREPPPPPAVNGRRIKPRYISQIKSRPPTFVLMCSRATQLPEQYRRYLAN